MKCWLDGFFAASQDIKRLELDDRVFQMFQTLRPRDEVEGSTMGLVTVKKLVEHQGREIHLGPGLDSKAAVFQLDWKKKNNKGTS